MARLENLSAGLILISLIFVQGINAGEDRVKVYALDECIKEALVNNWSIKAKDEKIEEAEYKKKQAKADFLPKFSTSYGYTRLSEVNRSSATPVSPARDLNTQDNYQWKGTISQTLFSGYALTSAYELAKLGIDQSKVDLELAKLDLALMVKEAYFNILKAEKGLDVAKKAVEALESHVRVNRNFYDVGMIPINDLLKAEVELGNAQYNLIKAQNASQLARASLNTLLARPINDPVSVEDILVYKSDRPDFNEYLTKAIDNRPEIKVIDITSIQIDEQIRLAKSKYYPSAVLAYDYIKAGDDPDVSGSAFHDANSWQITAALSWTFWEWGKTDDSIREKESLKKQLVQTRKALEYNIRLELKKALLDLDKAGKNIPTAKKAVEQAEENLRVSQERYKVQVTTSTEVLDAQTLLSQARTNYYNALYDHNLAKAALLRSIGKY
ncbi:MAG: TolC family protein [Deltaproteobacteria bacterium]|nr:TolC family protein [Deltaproteobacteria bacterium]